MNQKTINLDISYRCTLECPKCRRQQSMKRLGNKGHNMNIVDFKKIISYFGGLNFCGSISDPVKLVLYIYNLLSILNKKPGGKY